ncbi:MAG TPA: hypothetical protein VFD80_10215 [Flavobacteriaceae bacterium]|nr:hypothetical protein [Flavobacteriaceae bacterium]
MKPFEETQKFNQPWLRILVAIVLAVIIAPIIAFWEDIKFSEAPFWVTIGFGFLVIALFFFLLFILKLKTTIDARGIHYRFIPVMSAEKSFPWEKIKSCYTTTYRPIRDYGGWGYRISFKKGKAINVRGNQGIQLVLENNKKILIGTQKTKEAQKAIDNYFNQKQ